MSYLFKNSALIQLHAIQWLGEIKEKVSKSTTFFFLDDVPMTIWQSFKDQGFKIIYLLGVWEVDELTEEIFNLKNLKQEFDAVLPEWTWRDTCGSPFSIRKYDINPKLGSKNTLKNLKQKLNDLGLYLVLDFVPNHFGLTTGYINTSNLFMEEKNFSESTREYAVYNTTNGTKAFYHGKDPYFPPWEDTLQLDYSSHVTKQFMKDQIFSIADVCDGVRCDMAMLIVNRIIWQNWGSKIYEPLSTEFWSDAISEVKLKFPDFIFIAEVYWDMEEELLNLGFDYCYDKKLYDAIRDHDVGAFEYILSKNPALHERTVRFLENHDEPRANTVFSSETYSFAMIVTFSLPGIKFIHERQIEGYSRKSSLYLTKKANEDENKTHPQLYNNFFQVFIKNLFSNGFVKWNLNPAVFKKNIELGRNIYSWEWLNPTSQERVVIVVNFKNIGSLVELHENINQIIIFYDSNIFINKKISRTDNPNFMFELKPFSVFSFKFQF